MHHILIYAHEVYEDLELWYPKIRLEEAGCKVVIAGVEKWKVHLSKHGYPCKADCSFEEALSRPFSGVVIPGGYAPDKLRRVPSVLEKVRKLHEEKKMVAFICHAGWVPISAKILRDKNVTSTLAIKDDLVNAGALWHDQAVVVDGNLISSRTPEDLAVFCKAMVDYLR